MWTVHGRRNFIEVECNKYKIHIYSPFFSAFSVDCISTQPELKYSSILSKSIMWIIPLKTLYNLNFECILEYSALLSCSSLYVRFLLCNVLSTAFQSTWVCCYHRVVSVLSFYWNHFLFMWNCVVPANGWREMWCEKLCLLVVENSRMKLQTLFQSHSIRWQLSIVTQKRTVSFKNLYYLFWDSLNRYLTFSIQFFYYDDDTKVLSR